MRRIRFIPEIEPLLRSRPTKYPVYSPEITRADIRMVVDTLRDKWISVQAPIVGKFEGEFKKFIGSRNAIVCSSGTAAIECSLRALNIGAGDEVIIPDFTFIQIANSVLRVGAKPVLIDSTEGHPNMDLRLAEKKITVKTKAIIAVHTFGQPLDRSVLEGLKARYRLFVIEDCAESMGSRYPGGQMVGSLGDTGCFSLYANKLITAGEGGVITTRSRKLGELIREYRNHGYTKRYHFWHSIQGGNYKLSAMQVALAYSQLSRIQRLMKRKRLITRWYLKHLADVKGIELLLLDASPDVLCWMFPVLLEESFPISRGRLRNYLAGRGIETRTFFYPLSLQPCLKNSCSSGNFPNSLRFGRMGLYLPSSPLLKEVDVRSICHHIVRLSRHKGC